MIRTLCFLILLVPQLLDQYGKTIPRSKPRVDVGRTVRAKYDAAQTHTDNQNHWGNTDSLSAAAAHSPDVRRTLRERARYEVANNSYASGMVRTLANDTIGTGPSLQLQADTDPEDKQAAADVFAVESAWWNWSQAVRLPQKLRTMRMSKCVDGEAFGLFFTNRALRNPVKLDLKLYEAEQVANPWTNYIDPRLSDGIVFDDFGNVASYTLLKYHPGDTAFVDVAGESETIPARDMIHLFRCERPGQIRGVPEITPAIPLYAQLRRFTLAVIAAAETAADFAGLITSTSPSVDPDEVEPLDIIDIERRMLMTLPKGWDLSQLKAEQPATTYAMFKREIINEIARCLNMPLNVAAGDSSDYNYASGRLDHQMYFKSLGVDRRDFEDDALEPTFDRWWQEAGMTGVLPERFANTEPPPHCWNWPGREHVDPLKEANAQGVRLASHTTTLAREYARQGMDWETELRQRSKEVKLLAELGITSAATAPPAADVDDDDDNDEPPARRRAA